jgi:serralysin
MSTMISPSRKAAALRGFVFFFAFSCLAGFVAQAHAAFHLWAIREIYTNSSGNLQFIEMFDVNGSQQFTTGQQIGISNVGNTQTHTFVMPSDTASPTFNHALLFGTAGLTAAGGPTPDFIIPDGFLFSGGGTINFFGANSGAYTALPTDGNNSRAFPASTNQANTPQNFAGTVGHVVPEPATAMLSFSAGICLLFVVSRRRHARA